MSAPRRREMGDRERQGKLSRWMDFLAYMRGEFPETKTADGVTREMAAGYAAHLRDSGRYRKAVDYVRRGKAVAGRTSSTALSAETVNRHIKTCRELFRQSKCRNPFDEIPMMASRRIPREAFSLEEIRALLHDEDEAVRDIVGVGIHTGLRLADICNLRWDCVDWATNSMSVATAKTGAVVSMPILPGLMAVLERHLYNMSDYVMPDLHDEFVRDPSSISRRFKAAVSRHGMEGRRSRGDGMRAASVRDAHSLRHTFCHLAGMAGIPLAVVQSIVGHMSPEMTMRYSMHATARDRAEQMERLRLLLGE